MKRTEIAPAFQCYVADVLADIDALTDEERGWYLTLMCHAWRGEGVTTDPARISRILGVSPKRFPAAWKALGSFFEERDGKYVLPWQEVQRAQQAAKRVKRKLAADTRWGNVDADPHPEDGRRDANAYANEDASASGVQCSVVVSALATGLSTTDNNNSTNLARERSELTDLLPEAYRVDLDALLDRGKATHDSPVESRRLSWVTSLRMELAPNGPATPESLGKAMRALNTNGEMNWSRFLGYRRSIDAAESTPPGSAAVSRGGSRVPSSRDVESDGLAIFGELVENVGMFDIRSQAGNPDSPMTKVWRVRGPMWDQLEEAARKALAAIGGPYAVGTCPIDKRVFLATQFSKIYAANKRMAA